MLTYLDLYKKTIFYDVKEGILKIKGFDVIIFKEVKCELCCYKSMWYPKFFGRILILLREFLFDTFCCESNSIFN